MNNQFLLFNLTIKQIIKIILKFKKLKKIKKRTKYYKNTFFQQMIHFQKKIQPNNKNKNQFKMKKNKVLMNKLTGLALKTFRQVSKNTKFLSQTYKFQSLCNTQKFNFSDKYSEETMEKLKKEAQSFYENEIKQESDIVHINNVEQWKSEVMESKVPVLLDCYAGWCEPCKQLEPILMEQFEKLKGKVKLVKLNIDDNAEIASALQIKSIPTVYLISGANAVDGFVGLPAQKDLDKFFQSVYRVCGMMDEETDISAQITLAQTFLENEKSIDEAVKILNKILNDGKWKNRFGGKIHALLGLSNVLQGNINEYQKNINQLNKYFSEEKKEKDIAEILVLCEEKIKENQSSMEQHPFIDECLKKLEKDPLDHQTRYDLAQYQQNNNFNSECIDNCLFIIQKNRNWEDKKAQQLLISLFESLGSSNQLTIKGRQRLQRILY
ncbi:Thioredoxin-like fold [Pseudocohnilembus persalinus]|uniref:Thioredoxin-like fold n=1 Tax=Pseudocohnilembus persalinus TaxID=266149 RepID=A0A0V0QL30_PSEPJ|nr:Thioredoxin-like fold [Pseudocohnilembus persalinus]|eukprot:KRX02934.1 Thioredoxin-like fold [Pseudocohnilembus persalinus]